MAEARIVSAIVDDRERLRQLYAAKPMDHRAVAIAEREVWDAHLASGVGKKRRRDYWFFETFGLKGPAEVMFRQGILAREPWSEPLWAAINKASLNKVYRVCLDLEESPNRADDVRRLAENPDAIMSYRLKGTKSRGREKAKPIDRLPGEARDLRASLRELVKPFVQQKLSGFEDPSVADEIISEFEIQVQAAFTDVLARIQRLRSTNGAKLVIETKRRDLRRACEFLGLKVPPKGGVVDMELARRAHRKLSAQFHPDRTNGNSDLTDQYLEVQRAWEIVSNYQA